MKFLRMEWDPLYQMTRCDFKLRDQGSVFGFLWTLLSPALLFTLIYMIFSKWFGRFIPHFGWHLLIGLVYWNFFASATTNALTIFERKRYIARNFNFDKAILPTASILATFFSFAIENVILLTLIAVFHGITFYSLVIAALMVFVMLLLAVGTGLFLASLHVFFRDIQHIWGLLLRIGFFATPVFYPVQVIDARKLFILKLNPLYHVLKYSRLVLIKGDISVDAWMFYLAIFLVVLLGGAYAMFRKVEPVMAEYL
jgi:ABC-type polysaccharide/polyol phosphate export permease